MRSIASGSMRPAGIERLGVAAQRTEQRRVVLVAVPGNFKIRADALRRLRIDRQRFAPSALADHAQRIKAAVLVKVADIQRGDLRAAESDLQPDRKNGAVAQTGERVGRRRVEHFARLCFREGGGAALVAIDRRAAHIDDGITGDDAMPHQVLEQAGQRGQAAAHGRRFRAFLFALHPLPGDDGAMIDLAQLLRRAMPSARMKCATSSL